MAASILRPQHPHWNRDLLSCPGVDEIRPSLHREVNAISEAYVELGRERLAWRGVLLAFGLAGFLGATPALWMSVAGRVWQESVWLAVMLLAFALVLVLLTIYLVRLDLSMPRQLPVRLNRITGDIYINGYSYGWNPFGVWRSTIKVWRWSDVRAEILRQAGFGGQIYMVRYSLGIALCKPETNIVIDRDVLLGPSVTPFEFDQAWAYLKAYMTDGPGAVPQEPLKDNSVHYIRSLFSYVPWMMFNEWGKAARQDMFGKGVGPAIANALLVLVTLPLLPLFFVLGITNYIALKFAPEARWPEDLDAESRGITVKELQAEKERSRQQQKEGPRLSSVIAASVSVLIIGWIVGRILDLV